MGHSRAPVDRHGRRVEYLRISLTERCNLRCVYCRPAGVDEDTAADVLSTRNVVNTARAAASVGISRIRLTGGEPLLRDDLEEIVSAIAALPGIADLSLTTNGQGLASRAAGLAEAGLHRVNVSLDSLVPETYAALTGGGDLARSLAGVRAALRAGLNPVKVNVVMAGRRLLEETELRPFAEWVRAEPIHVRFIEVMPGCGGAACLPADEVLARLRKWYDVEPAAGPGGGGPAKYFRLRGSAGTIGFITPLSAPFCDHCNRLRVNARGELMPCLFSRRRFDLRAALDAEDPVSAVAEELLRAALEKPARYGEEPGPLELRAMHAIGG